MKILRGQYSGLSGKSVTKIKECRFLLRSFCHLRCSTSKYGFPLPTPHPENLLISECDEAGIKPLIDRSI